VVNGALEYLAKDLGIAENAVLQGMSYFYSPAYSYFPGFLIVVVSTFWHGLFPSICKGTSETWIGCAQMLSLPRNSCLDR
jgi:hypothetical protein